MLGNIVMTEDQEERKKSSSDYNINRGFELMLRKASKKKRNDQDKKYQIRYGKIFQVFNFEFSFDFSMGFDFKRLRKDRIRN